MPVAGIDIGAGTAKMVILENDSVVSSAVIPVRGNVLKAVEEVTDMALDGTGLSIGGLGYVVSTGYGRDVVPFAHYSTTEIICHATGIHFLMPHIKTIIDIGAQDSKVIRINDEGKVTNFMMNDKCAAGTGRFLEVMANVLGLELSEMGPSALTSKNPCTISSTCTVFAETEVIALRAQGKAVEDLVEGIHRAMVSRLLVMSSQIRLDQETAFTGGVAKNIGVQKVIEELGNVQCTIPIEPQETGALGAALIARTRLMEAR
ncbi:MAG: 2-hydroxyglutaryl-CoA dehydratase [Dehalococcoidales bacterium]|nr:2-hydroxyglutaryl-CoA dehydratase [Dehalococcoidales bacterium]